MYNVWQCIILVQLFVPYTISSTSQKLIISHKLVAHIAFSQALIFSIPLKTYKYDYICLLELIVSPRFDIQEGR